MNKIPWCVALRIIRRNFKNISATTEILARVELHYQIRVVKLSIMMRKRPICISVLDLERSKMMYSHLTVIMKYILLQQ